LSSRQNANGWEASISGNFYKWFSVEGDVSGYYKSYSVNLTNSLTECQAFVCGGTASAKVTDYSFAAGPRINLRPIFIHALFGGDHLTGTASASGVSGTLSESQNGVAGLAGGGVQWKVSGLWSIRASADYIFTRHNIFGGPSVTQNNYRAGVGIVYSFGARHQSERTVSVSGSRAAVNVQPIHKEPANIHSGAGVNLPSLGVIVAIGRISGAQITDEAPNGLAALAGLHPGDVINAVDGKPVNTPMELAAELSNRPAGDNVRLGYLIRGTWQTETVILLNATR
jgi:membrane-associated protease RseP (regulator of RpoE activity)